MAAAELYTTPLFTDANLLSYYRFEGNSNDAKGTNNGTATNITYGTANGKFAEGAVSAAAGGDGINIGNPANLNFTSGDFSFNFWFYPQINTNNKTVFSRGEYQVEGYYCSIFTNGSDVDMGFYTNQVGALQTTLTTTAFELNNWHMVSIVRSGTACNIYKNGTVCSYETKESIINPATSSKNMYLLRYDGTSYETTAKIDDFAIFNRALTQTELTNLYTGNWPAAVTTAMDLNTKRW